MRATGVIKMTDIYDTLYAVLDADDWSNYGSQPPMFDSGIITQDTLNKGDFILITPGERTHALSGTNSIAFTRTSAIIEIIATTKANRDKLYQDVKDALGSSYRLLSESLDSYPDYYVRIMEVELLE